MVSLSRAEICAAVCEGLSDAELRLIAENGGLRRLADMADLSTRMASIVELWQTMPPILEKQKATVIALRPKLIEMLALMEEL